MAKYKNDKNVSLSVAVWLANDSYDHSNDPNTISVTTFIKPLKQIILGARATGIPGAIDPEELSDLVASRMGTAFHDSIENAWLNNYKQAMCDLGYPDQVTDNIKINPTEIQDEDIPIYMEQRATRQAGPFKITGKFDFVGDGRVEDFKSTGVFTYSKTDANTPYILQGSMYKWLNPRIITQDTMAIQFIFTDWQAVRAKSDKNYPQNRVVERVLKLMSLAETQAYVDTKAQQLTRLMDAEEVYLPPCTPTELWQSATVFKYYKNPTKTTRSTKNFDTLHEANTRLIADGSVGIVKESQGQVRACKYCRGRNQCKQKDIYIANGTLTI